ncbi:MAG TPA: hypothetical protein VLE93_01355 [Candidatus Saccharimonadales bacterium]|nr:hypothetical protein [Candidatus Saccharimonadales bacterium]
MIQLRERSCRNDIFSCLDLRRGLAPVSLESIIAQLWSQRISDEPINQRSPTEIRELADSLETFQKECRRTLSQMARRKEISKSLDGKFFLPVTDCWLERMRRMAF